MNWHQASTAILSITNNVFIYNEHYIWSEEFYLKQQQRKNMTDLINDKFLTETVWQIRHGLWVEASHLRKILKQSCWLSTFKNSTETSQQVFHWFIFLQASLSERKWKASSTFFPQKCFRAVFSWLMFKLYNSIM